MTSVDLIEMKQKIAEYERLENVYRLCDRFAEELKSQLPIGSRIYFGVNTQESTFHLHLTKAQCDKLSDLILEFKDDARKEMNNL